MVWLQLYRMAKKVQELLARIRKLEGPPKPMGYPVYSMKWHEAVDMLAEQGVGLMLKTGHQPDADLFYTSEESWAEIIPFLTYPAKDYVKGKKDCDDYADWAVADASRHFGLHCLHARGHIPEGYHAFGLVLIGPSLFKVFDPNAGFPHAGTLFDKGEHGYNVEYWKR